MFHFHYIGTISSPLTVRGDIDQFHFPRGETRLMRLVAKYRPRRTRAAKACFLWYSIDDITSSYACEAVSQSQDKAYAAAHQCPTHIFFIIEGGALS